MTATATTTTSTHNSANGSQPRAPLATPSITRQQQRKGRRMRRSPPLLRCHPLLRNTRSGLATTVLVSSILVLLSTTPLARYGGVGVVVVEASDYSQYNGNYYYNDDANNNNADDGNNNGDDAAAAAADDYYANADDGGNNYNNDDANDDANANNNGDDAVDDDYQNYQNDGYNNDDANDDGANYANGDDNSYSDEEAAAYANADDDVFHWNSNVGFEGVSVMPISCINYNGGQMIKFQLFDSENSYQCHFSEIATFVVSIAHYMRAYFNYEALLDGQDFELPGDAGYLNCVMLQETMNADTPLYAKIGCMDRETFTSTKLQIHVYTDNQCSQFYDDGQTSRKHATKGYDFNGYTFQTRVSFRPAFYNCDSCSPNQISDTYNKQNGNWYDDYYISQYGKSNNQNNNDDGNANDAYQRANDDVPRDDDYAYANQDYNYNSFQGDDNNYYAADDANANADNNDDANNANNNYNNDDANANNNYYNNDDDDYYTDDGGRIRHRALESTAVAISSVEAAAPGQLEAYYREFWGAYDEMQSHRSLYENNYDAGDWNMCQRIYKYGVWCDEECRALDFFRTDQWSASDIFLLSIMCTFVTAMMLLVVAKRLKAQQKAKIYGEEQPMPGLPPLAMALIFFVIMATVIALSKLKFVNETLVFAVVTCILLFIYVLRLTLFESPRPVLLAAPSYYERYDERNFDASY